MIFLSSVHRADAEQYYDHFFPIENIKAWMQTYMSTTDAIHIKAKLIIVPEYRSTTSYTRNVRNAMYKQDAI